MVNTVAAKRDYQGDTELESHILAVLQLEESAEKLVIAGDADAAKASGWLVQISRKRGEMEKKRVLYTKPLLDHKKRIDSDFKQYMEPLDRASGLIRNSLLTWKKLQDKIRLEAEATARRVHEDEQKRIAEEVRVQHEKEQQERLAAALEKNEPPPAPVPVPVTLPLPAPIVAPAPMKTTRVEGGGGVTATKRWVFEITSEKDIPREYCIPDKGKIRRLVQAGIREIPGVRIYAEESLSVRRGG